VGRRNPRNLFARLPIDPDTSTDSARKTLGFTGLRLSEGLSLSVEDLALSLDNEHPTIVGKGGKRRTILLDDPRLAQQRRTYLKRMGYKHGPLFRAKKNGRGGPLRYL
jgi:integrase/recombinase XerD